jgi:hypothetical protein
MAGVPDYGGFKVNPTGPNDERFQTPDTSGMAENGRQLARFGQTLQQAGEVGGKIFAAEQEKANDLRVIDAENAAREAAINLTVDDKEGYTSVKGGDVMHRASGQPLAEEWRGKYDQKLADIMGGLSNDAQRQAFRQSAAQLSTSFYAKAKEYEGQQYQGWQQSVVKGSAELAGQEIALNYNDTGFIDQRLGTLDVAVAKLGKLNGTSGDEITALQNTARSEAITGAIKAALDADDTGTAQTLFDTYKDKMLAPDRGKIEGPLQREMMGKTALSIGDQVFSQVPGTGIDQPASDKTFDALIQQESSGGKNLVGPLTKYGRALGAGQTLPDTARAMAKRLGIAWQPERLTSHKPEDIAYQKQLAAAYWKEALQKCNGNVYDALCYYHGGPDRDQWGPKTRAYAANVMKRVGGKPDQPYSAPTATLEDALASGRRLLMEQNPNPSYDQIKAVDEEITHRWQVHKASTDQAEEQTVSSAMTQLYQNGGDINALPPSLRNAIPGDKWGSVLGFASTVRSFGKQRDPEKDDALYNFAITHPEVIKNASTSNFLDKFAGHPKFEEIAKYRGQLRGEIPVGGKEGNPGNLSYETINRAVDSRLEAIGIDPKDDKKAGQVGAVRRIVNGAIAGEQRRLGRPLTDAETESFIDRQFAKSRTLSHYVLGVNTSDERVPMFSINADQIPSAMLQQIDDALDKQGQPKTDQNRLLVYYRMVGQ